MAPPASSRRACQSEQQATVVLLFNNFKHFYKKLMQCIVSCATVGRYGSSCTLLAVLSSALATGSRELQMLQSSSRNAVSAIEVCYAGMLLLPGEPVRVSSRPLAV
jgi:hypothetical protein